MENIERTQFVVLTGHLDDQPLPDLVRTLRVQRKSGRLQVEYPDAPGSFFFEDGQLVDAQLGSLRGLEALYAALSLRGAAFNFNPLVRPPERSIDRQQQKFIADMVEAPRRESLPEIEAAPLRPAGPNVVPLPPPQHAPLLLGPVAAELIAPLEERLVAVEAAITSASRRFSRERLIYASAISFLLGLIVVTAVQALFDPLSLKSNASPAAAETAQAQKPDAAAKAAGVETRAAGGEAAQTNPAATARNVQAEVVPAARERGSAAQAAGEAKRSEPASAQASRATAASASRGAAKSAREPAAPAEGYVVQVLMQVKNGQVTAARVLNPRPGAGDYESLALRMAKQRRYPENFTGAERLRLKVKP